MLSPSCAQTELRELPRKLAVTWGPLIAPGQAVSGTVPACYQPCPKFFDGVYLLTSVDLSLQLTPNEEVQRVECRTSLWPRIRLDEGRPRSCLSFCLRSLIEHLSSAVGFMLI